MKQILADITPMGSNNLFVTHYWPDKQTDPPLHYHEDYMLCLTLHVRGQRIMDDAVEDFTEKDLVLINPGTPHRFKRDAAYADAKCETATVMFSREMPDWKFLSLEHMRPIREMLLRPAAGLRFAPKTIDTVLERMISLPKLDGFEAVSLFFSILNDLATAPPDEVQQIGSRHDGSYQDDRVRRIVRFVEESYSRKLSLEEIGRSVDMSPSSVCRYFKRRTHQNLWEYINSFRINRAAQLIVETQLPISEIGPPLRIHQRLEFQPSVPRPPRNHAQRLPQPVQNLAAHAGYDELKRGAPFIRRRLFFTIRADQRTSTFQGEYIRTPCWFRASRTVLYSFIISPSSERAKASRTLTFSEAMIAAKPVGSSFTSTTR